MTQRKAKFTFAYSIKQLQVIIKLWDTTY